MERGELPETTHLAWTSSHFQFLQRETAKQGNPCSLKEINGMKSIRAYVKQDSNESGESNVESSPATRDLSRRCSRSMADGK